MKKVMCILLTCFMGSFVASHAQSIQDQINALNTRIGMDKSAIASLQGEIAVARNVETTDLNLINVLNTEIQISGSTLNELQSPAQYNTIDNSTADSTITTNGQIDTTVNAFDNSTDNSTTDKSVNAVTNSVNSTGD